MPGAFQAIYNGTKAFMDSFSFALRNELKDSGVTVTCLMPGATDTEFFARAEMLDTKVGAGKKDDPADAFHAFTIRAAALLVTFQDSLESIDVLLVRECRDLSVFLVP